MNDSRSRRAESTLRRQVLRALQGLRSELSVGQAADAFLPRRIEALLDHKLALAKGTVRKAFMRGHEDGVKAVAAWR